MAAEALSESGHSVDLYEAMPSVGRKFLLAGKGGLNLTHSRPLPSFLERYGLARSRLQPLIESFGPEQLRQWASQLGVETFVGSSGRVFPTDFKAAPLLRGWLRRLRGAGVNVLVRQHWTGWGPHGELTMEGPQGSHSIRPQAVVLALGGGSWARLGSTGAWVPWLQARGVEVAPLRPANCGFEVAWSNYFRERFAGHALKSVVASFGDCSQQGEFVVTETGVEGSLIYALSAAMRDHLDSTSTPAVLTLDLAPDFSRERLLKELSRPRGSNTVAKHLRNRAHLDGVKAGLLREVLQPAEMADCPRLVETIKALPLSLTATRPLDEAISSAGGVRLDQLDDGLMIRALPGVFCAGEMLDWEAPTGGYLLTACFASGRAAGLGAARWLACQPHR
jgi:uncharacterized flavoprotein (TIGR03862 family)